ncbi:MAG: amino acid ABC transporter permease [Trichococcus flocculiformis]
MNLFAKAESNAPKTQAELLFAAQQRKERNFRTHVAITWGILLLLLMFLFSGPIKVDTTFIRENMVFIAGGVGETIRISILSIILATILALLAALGRLSTFPPIYALSTFYVSLIRGTPLYLQIMFFFLALPQLDIRLPGLWAGVIALGLNYGAYMSEIFRAGLASVGKGQREAATALGMTPGQTMKRVILPQAHAFRHSADRQRIHRHDQGFCSGFCNRFRTRIDVARRQSWPRSIPQPRSIHHGRHFLLDHDHHPFLYSRCYRKPPCQGRPIVHDFHNCKSHQSRQIFWTSARSEECQP